MGCFSSKILSKSGSFQEKVVSHGFKGSNLIEEIILSNPKRNGDQFLALLRAADDRSTPTAAAAADQSPAIETINVSDLLAGLEEEDAEERNGGEKVFDATTARARSFRTVEEFDAMVTQSTSPPAKLSSSPEQDEESRASRALPPATPSSSSSSAAAADQEALGVKSSEQEESAVSAAAGGGGGGNKRRARARQLGELKVAPAFDFSKSGSLRDWLLQGGQIFSPGSYVTPKFGAGAGVAATVPPPPQEHGVNHGGEQSVFDPELVAQFEQAMERLSEEEERALEEILEAMGASPAAAEEVTASDRPVMVQE
uniref:Uncharacterized protein n=1 Tax=Leersia perrieri TaxID=77586 RepID=A0A0D9X9C9_9ORYZ